MVKNPPANAGDTRDASSIPGSGRFPGGGHGNPLQYSCMEYPIGRGAWWAAVHGGKLGFPGGTVIKNLPANAGDTRDAPSVPGWRRYPGVANSNPLWYSCLENSMDRESQWATVHGVTKSEKCTCTHTCTSHLTLTNYTNTLAKLQTPGGTRAVMSKIKAKVKDYFLPSSK